MVERDERRWTLQVCSECGWHILDENHARSDADEAVGGDCESYLVDDGEFGSCGPCDIVEVMPVAEYEAALRAVRQVDDAMVARIVRHIAGMVFPESGHEYGQIPRQLVYDARAALNPEPEEKPREFRPGVAYCAECRDAGKRTIVGQLVAWWCPEHRDTCHIYNAPTDDRARLEAEVESLRAEVERLTETIESHAAQCDAGQHELARLRAAAQAVVRADESRTLARSDETLRQYVGSILALRAVLASTGSEERQDG